MNLQEQQTEKLKKINCWGAVLAAGKENSVRRRYIQTLISRELQLLADTMA